MIWYPIDIQFKPFITSNSFFCCFSIFESLCLEMQLKAEKQEFVFQFIFKWFSIHSYQTTIDIMVTKKTMRVKTMGQIWFRFLNRVSEVWIRFSLTSEPLLSLSVESILFKRLNSSSVESDLSPTDLLIDLIELNSSKTLLLLISNGS